MVQHYHLGMVVNLTVEFHNDNYKNLKIYCLNPLYFQSIHLVMTEKN